MTAIDWANLPYNEWPYTPPLEDYLAIEEADPHMWWRMDSRHHRNLFLDLLYAVGETPWTRKISARNAAVIDALTVGNRPRTWVQREFGLSVEEVTNILRAYGLPLRTGQIHIPLEVYDGIENAIVEEWAREEIMRTFKVSTSVFVRWFPEFRGWGPGASERSLEVQMSGRGLSK